MCIDPYIGIQAALIYMCISLVYTNVWILLSELFYFGSIHHWYTFRVYGKIICSIEFDSGIYRFYVWAFNSVFDTAFCGLCTITYDGKYRKVSIVFGFVVVFSGFTRYRVLGF